MTVQELYEEIGADYEQAKKVLRVDKLIDKHIRKLPANGVVDTLLEAGEAMDPTAMFETSHAVKGICANLGLTSIADAASVISEEFRPGNPRTMSDEEVKAKLGFIRETYEKTKAGIARYTEG
jgi:HPt (histidine-containing phosphotransfer) domain-containing protein